MMLVFIAIFCVAFLAGGPSFARDMMGVVDLKNHAVIPCTYKTISYVGCGLYLCEGFEKGPGTRIESLNFVPLGSLPEKARESALMYGSGNPKVLLDRYGNKIKLVMPKGAALLNVFIPEKIKRAYLTDAGNELRTGAAMLGKGMDKFETHVTPRIAEYVGTVPGMMTVAGVDQILIDETKVPRSS